MYERRLSVIIPTRNESQTIGAAIEQFVPFFEKYDLEVIVSDANSTDETREIVRDFLKKHPGRVLSTQKLGKQNIAIGRNLGAAVASGEILLHTDADVRLPDPVLFFDTIFREFAADPLLAAATVPIRVYAEEATQTDRFYHWLMNTVIHFSTKTAWCLSKGECQIVRRSVFDQIDGYDERLIAGEDCNLFYRLNKVGRLAFFAELEVRHSPRRFRQLSYWRVSYQYFMEGITRYFLGKSFAREWKVVR